MVVGIISAMDSEHRQLAERLQNKKSVENGLFCYVEGMLGDNQVILTQCGIGKVNAAVGTLELIRRYQPHCIISTGVAGGIDDSLRITDVVASLKTVYHDVWCGEGNEYGQVQGEGLPLFFPCNETLLKTALSLNETAGLESRVHGGLICSGDQFIAEPEKLADIKKHFPEGFAVDMESCAIAQVCFLYGVQFLSFRIISDMPGADDNDFSQYLNFWDTMAERSFQTTWAFLSALPAHL